MALSFGQSFPRGQCDNDPSLLEELVRVNKARLDPVLNPPTPSGPPVPTPYSDKEENGEVKEVRLDKKTVLWIPVPVYTPSLVYPFPTPFPHPLSVLPSYPVSPTKPRGLFVCRDPFPFF